jgi:peptide chain release factor 2
MRQLAEQKRVVERWRGVEKAAADAAELAALDDESLEAEIESEVNKLASRLDEMELERAFSGDYDDRNAILSIHAGAGGTESQDWAQMLMRMYLRWAERRGYKAEVLDVSPGEEAGIKSAVIDVSGDYATGYLKSEHGVHRLVRLSPFDADHARHTSFALVEVMPEAEADVDVRPRRLKGGNLPFQRARGAAYAEDEQRGEADPHTHRPVRFLPKRALPAPE